MDGQKPKTLLFERGAQIIYIPLHAEGDEKHPDCEEGFVTSTTPKAVFCRFWFKGTNELRTKANSESCNYDSLRFKNTRPPDVVAQALIKYCGGQIMAQPVLFAKVEADEPQKEGVLAGYVNTGRWPEPREELLEVPADNKDKWPKPTVEQPSLDELEAILFADENATATDGCENIEPDGQCQHGYPAWPHYLGLV